MTGIKPGSESLFFRSREQIVDHILNNVLNNQSRFIGTEWEVFLLDQNGKAITRANGQKAFLEFKDVFSLLGYRSELVFDKPFLGNPRPIVGLDIPELGYVGPEIGHQFEFSASVSANCDEVEEKNREFHRAFIEVAKRLNHSPVFLGHVPGHVDTTEGSYRRSEQWRNHFRRFGNRESRIVREVLEGTAATQVTVDGGADKFHEFVQTLLLIDPALTFYYANSDRSHISVQVHSRYMGSHVNPIIGAWQTKNPREAVEAIVDRLLDLQIPFLFDPSNPGEYKPEILPSGKTPTVRDFMHLGRLNEKVLYNTGAFFQMHPAFRNFFQALLEVRGVDCLATPEKVTEFARRVAGLLYDDDARERLLCDYSYLTGRDVELLHAIVSMKDKNMAANMTFAGIRMQDFVDDIIARSDAAAPSMAVRGGFKQKIAREARQGLVV